MEARDVSVKTIDNHSGSAVFVGQVASNPRVNGRNRTEIAVFLCPTDERLSGVGVIQYLFAGNIPAVSIDGLRHPAALKADQLKKQWRPTMNYCTKCGDSPYDALNAVNAQLALLTDLTSQASDVTLSDKAVAGLYWFLQEVEEITTAVLAHEKELAS